MKKLLYSIISAFLLYTSQAQGAVYYIANNGDDTRSCAVAQSVATPRQTMAGLAACLNAGDFGYARAGTYVGINNNVTSISSGTSYSNAVTFSAYPGETATLVNNGSSDEVLNLTSPTLQYVVFKDFRIDGGNLSGAPGGQQGINFFDTISYIKLENLTHIGNTGNACVGLNDARTHHIWVTGGSYGNCGSYGIYVEGPDNIFEKLVIHNTGQNNNPITKNAFHVFTNYPPFNTPNRNIIRDIITYNTDGILVWRGADNEVYNNIVFNTLTGSCFSIAGGATDTKVYNNTAVNCLGPAYELTSAGQPSVRTILKNNIHWLGNSTSVVLGTDSTLSHNAFYVSGSTGAGAQNGVNPLFANVAGEDFRPCTAAGVPHASCTGPSPMLDTGTALTYAFDIVGTARPQGAAWDKGAYESGGVGAPSCNVTPALVGQYSFDTNATDSSGLGNNGTLGTGVSIVAGGKYSGAALLSGTGAVTILHHSSLWMCNGYTLGVWLKPSNVPTDFTGVINKYGDGDSGYFMYSATTPGFCTNGGPAAGYQQGDNVYTCYDTPFPQDVWTHYAEKWDGSLLSHYINGTLVATQIATALLDNSVQNLFIGGSVFGEFFNGLIDEVWIANCGINPAPGAPACAPAGMPTTIVSLMNTPINALSDFDINKFNASIVRKNNAAVVRKYGLVQ